MFSYQLLRALMVEIQSERNPIYRAELRHHIALDIRLIRVAQVLIFALFVIIGVSSYLGSSIRTLLAGNSDNWLALILILGALGLSIAPVGLAGLVAGNGIIQDRIAQALAVMRLTSIPLQQFLIARVAASLRTVWLAIVTISAFSLILSVLIAAPAAALRAQSGLLDLLWAAIAVSVILIERVQEISLSVSLSLWLAATAPTRWAAWFGLIGGILIRIALLLLIYQLIPSPIRVEPMFAILTPVIGVAAWFVLAALGGSVVLMAAAPGLPMLSIVLALLILRELLIRFFFRRAGSAMERIA